MAKITPKAAKIMTIAGAVNCLTAIGMGIVIFLGHINLPLVIPALLLVSGIMIIFVSLSFYTER